MRGFKTIGAITVCSVALQLITASFSFAATPTLGVKQSKIKVIFDSWNHDLVWTFMNNGTPALVTKITKKIPDTAAVIDLQGTASNLTAVDAILSTVSTSKLIPSMEHVIEQVTMAIGRSSAAKWISQEFARKATDASRTIGAVEYDLSYSTKADTTTFQFDAIGLKGI